MLKVASLLLLPLAVPAVAGAQTPPHITPAQAWIDERPMYFQGGCLEFNGQPACWDGARPTAQQVPRAEVAPGGTLTLRFAEPASTVDVPPGIGTLTPVDGHVWTLTLDPDRVASFPLPVNATLAGEVHAGLAHFSASVAVKSHAVTAATLRRSVARARVAVPARGTVRAHVVIRGKRRSAVVTRTFSAAGERRLRLNVRRGVSGTAWLVVRYTFPGAKPVEISQRLVA